ncbi:hypothetical protein [Rhodoflexus caldus]|uniref:hypothetical protein n=1 Tax=Rhodoflexus caldus TaxID=2891236 RepID=UPI002029D94C|nr:hypothetical protein [Rhodoflexus caldus]
MKKLIITAAAIWFIAAAAFGQVGDLLKKAKEKVQNKIEEKSGTAKQEPAPSAPTGNPPANNNNNNGSNNLPSPDAALSYTPIATVMAQKITDLPEGTFIFYDESRMFSTATRTELVLVAGHKVNKTIQVFRDGKWSEPIKNSDRKTVAQYGITSEIGSSKNLYRFAAKVSPPHNEGDKGLIQFRKLMMNGIPIGEEQVIVHNGKTYGPYALIQEAALSTDGKSFFAIVMPNYSNDYSKIWQEYRLISDQMPTPLQIVPPDRQATNIAFSLLASGDGKNAAVIITDFSNYQQVKQELLLNDGRRFPVEQAKDGSLLFDYANSFFSPDGKSFCSLQNGTKLYVNGKLTKTFSEYQDLSNTMFNEKGEELFKVSRGGIAFADGTVAPVAMQINTFMENGKMTVSWLAPYKDGSVYLCKKTL